ncbi:MAG: 4Fe-4S binding protein, partial [Planctomycetota bacterium]
LDYPLRGFKYFLMFFFVWNIMVQMNLTDLENFMGRPYHQVMDIRMLKFFTGLSVTTGVVLLVLGFLSIGIPHFWCRYLCPYGALMGSLSWLSPFKIHRNKKTCIDCQKCTKVCPARVQVHNSAVVWSDECNACLQCVDVCPVNPALLGNQMYNLFYREEGNSIRGSTIQKGGVNDTLYLSVTKNKFRLKPLLYAIIIGLIFLCGTMLARLAGVWQNNISTEEYQELIKHINEPPYLYGH